MCRPFANSRPSPTAATIAVAIFGPTPRTQATLRQASFLAENTFYALIELVDASVDLVKKGKKTSEHLAAELGQVVVLSATI